jgi:presenilin-like A22 family membrane protease
MKLNPTLPAIVVLVLSQIIALSLTVQAKAQGVVMQVNSTPQSLEMPIVYIACIIVSSLAMLFVMKLKFKIPFIKALMCFVVWDCMFILSLVALSSLNNIWSIIGILLFPVLWAGLVLIYPEWYIINITGICICGIGAAMLGVNFGLLPVILLLVVMAGYDFVAVYISKHMLDIAGYAIDEHLPLLFVFPKTFSFSYINTEWNELQENKAASILGFGDIVFPSILVISANTFIQKTGFVTLPALGAIIGSVIGIIGLYWFAEKYPQGHAGLPILNGATLCGFGIALIISLVIS